MPVLRSTDGLVINALLYVATADCVRSYTMYTIRILRKPRIGINKSHDGLRSGIHISYGHQRSTRIKSREIGIPVTSGVKGRHPRPTSLEDLHSHTVPPPLIAIWSARIRTCIPTTPPAINIHPSARTTQVHSRGFCIPLCALAFVIFWHINSGLLSFDARREHCYGVGRRARRRCNAGGFQ